MWTFRRPFGSVGGGEGCWHATPSAQVLVSGYHCPLKGTRDPWEKGSFQGWGRENTKGACFGKLTMAGSEEVLVKRWGWIGRSQKPAWGSHSRGTLKPVGEKDEEEQMSACARSAFLPTTRWPITEGRSLGRNQVDSLYQRFTVNTTDPCCDAENTASLFVAVLPKMHNLEQEKTTDKSKWGNIPQSNRPTLCKVASPWHERTGELSMSQVTKVTRLQNAVGSPGLDPRPEKKDVREKNEWSSTRMGIG